MSSQERAEPGSAAEKPSEQIFPWGVTDFRKNSARSAMLVVDDDGRNRDSNGAGSSASHVGFGSKRVEGRTKQLDSRIEIFRPGGTRIEIQVPLPAAA